MGGGFSTSRGEGGDSPTSLGGSRRRGLPGRPRSVPSNRAEGEASPGGRGGSPGGREGRSSHWCHQCSRAVRLNTNSLCSVCGGGFVEEVANDSAIPLLSALQAVQQLNQIHEEQAAGRRGGADETGFIIRGGNRPQEIRIEVLLRELQTHLRMAEGMRTAMRELMLEEDVVEQTQYNPSPTNGVQIDPLKEEKWRNIKITKISSEGEYKAWQLEHHNSEARQEEACAICCGALFEGEPVEICELNGCHHEFHRDCLQEWFARASSCPICRCDLNNAKEDRESEFVEPPTNQSSSSAREAGDSSSSQSRGIAQRTDRASRRGAWQRQLGSEEDVASLSSLSDPEYTSSGEGLHASSTDAAHSIPDEITPSGVAVPPSSAASMVTASPSTSADIST
ncbi:unnamed protein product [Amoebophrya sp. A25]|nr:unnamed protein product [Amoebophrya sp. A25]|eukprot:GSA25T00023341001.1